MNSKNTPILIAVAIPVVAIAFALVSISLKNGAVGNVKNEDFPAQAYLKNPSALAANKYCLNAQVDSQLAADSNARVICVRASSGGRLALIVPENLKANIMAGQRYNFTVDVQSDGALVVTKMEKF